MTDDDRLARRKGAIPVSVRRPLGAELLGPAVDPALTQNPAAPPAPSNPHIIYINNMPATLPAAAPVAAIPPLSASVIHHHHYAAQPVSPQPMPRVSIRLPAPPSHSALGMASLALGIIACVVCWVPWLGLVAVPVGAIGAVIGLLGTLVSLLFRKSSASLPIAGIFVCCLAAAISIASTRSLPYWHRQLDQMIAAVAPLLPIPSHAPTPSPSIPPPPAPAAQPGLFDTGDAASPSPLAKTTSPQSPTPLPVHPAIVSHVDPAIAAARDQLAAAERDCDARTLQSSDYQSALQAAADARARETALRETAPGSADLKQASQDMIGSDNAVSDLLTRAQASDPKVIAARQALAAARSAATVQ